MHKKIWFDARGNSGNREQLILTVNQSSHFDGILYNVTNIEHIHHSERLRIAFMVETTDELSEVLASFKEDKRIIIISAAVEILRRAKEEGVPTGFYIYIVDEESMERAFMEGGKHDYVLVEFKDETNIPLELIIAKLQNTQTDIIKCVETVDDARVSKEVMEVGCDGILLRTNHESAIMELNSVVEENKRTTLEVVKARVTNVQHLGPGERACIDTTSLLTAEEAMIIGSTSGGGLLVCSETHYLPYMNLRPFRVNAGAVHSYVWCPNDTTEYITDLRVGSTVSVIDIHGNVRTVNVGRVKIEVRPLLLIEAEYQDYKVNTIVQDDWHIRLFDGNHRPQNSTNFKVGDEILAYVCEPGRHVGIKIDETITEN